MIYLIRHGECIHPDAWSGDSDLRPLTDAGWNEVRTMDKWLRKEGVSIVFSSPALRCTETVQPLVTKLNLVIRRRAAIGSQAIAADAVPFLEANNMVTTTQNLPDAGIVMSSHGELIVLVVAELAKRGMKFKGDIVSDYASVWAIEPDFSKAKYYRLEDMT